MKATTRSFTAVRVAFKNIFDALDPEARRTTLVGVVAMTLSAFAGVGAAAMLALAVTPLQSSMASMSLAASVALGVVSQALDVVKWRCHAEAELRLDQKLTASMLANALGVRGSVGLGAEMQALGNALAGCRLFFQHIVFTAPAVVLTSMSAAVLVGGLGHLALALAMLAYAPVYLVAACWRARRMARAASIGTTARIETARGFADALGNREVVRAFGADEFVTRGLERSLMRATKWSTLLVRLRAGAAALNVGVYAAALTGVLWLAWTMAGDATERVTLVVFASVTLASLARPLEMAAQAFRDLILALALVEPLIRPREQRERLLPVDTSPATVCLQNVSVSYGEGREILSATTWACARGAKVGLRGDSGAGKSTVVRLLTGQVVPATGKVTIAGSSRDGTPVMAIALQETYLLDASIRANIAFGREASDEEIAQAVSIAGLTSLVKKLPQGLQTRVGERGSQLSGGERQRVALARAILKPAALYIFDEATSALDLESERCVMQRVVESRRCATMVIVSHRQSAFSEVDSIFEVRAGGLVQAKPRA